VLGLALLVLVVGAACAGSAREDGIRGCPREDWPGPWAACAEARWVGRVVEAGGYSVGYRGTGSALTADGKGRAFFVWAAESGARYEEPVDDGVRTSWSAQGYTFWVESGPGVTEVKPTIPELEPVVAASRRIPPPPE
jgi:hypothetical protein